MASSARIKYSSDPVMTRPTAFMVLIEVLQNFPMTEEKLRIDPPWLKRCPLGFVYLRIQVDMSVGRKSDYEYKINVGRILQFSG